MNKQKIEDAVIRFSDLIERKKDQQAYSDYKEGINEGLELAKDTFDGNAEQFVSSSSDYDRSTEIKMLQDKFNLLIDRLTISKKPRYSQDSFDGIYKGLEMSKELFRDFIEEFCISC